jgi:hypothetical protein
MRRLLDLSVQFFFNAMRAAKLFTFSKAKMIQQSSSIACHSTFSLLDSASSIIPPPAADVPTTIQSPGPATCAASRLGWESRSSAPRYQWRNCAAPSFITGPKHFR